eukprot:15434603-Alexandrium_andersonii.AAC.1
MILCELVTVLCELVMHILGAGSDGRGDHDGALELDAPDAGELGGHEGVRNGLGLTPPHEADELGGHG